MWIAGHNQLFTCACDGDIELSVNDMPVFNKTVGSKKFQLIEILYGKTVDDDVSLTPLVTFHGVNGYLFQLRYASFLEFFANQSNLIAIWNNYTNGFGWVEMDFLLMIDFFQAVADDVSFVDVNFVRDIRTFTEFTWNENHAMCYGVVQLMRKWYGLKFFLEIEMLIRKLGYIRMHTSLMA